jgi:hypothetical protein
MNMENAAPTKKNGGDGQLDLDKAHLPTGWVTMEEVIGFLIVERGVIRISRSSTSTTG